MKCVAYKLFAGALVLFSTIPLNAQNLMNKIYAKESLGPINRGDFNEDGIPDVVFLNFGGVEVGKSDSQGRLTFLSSDGNTQGNGGDLAVARFTASGHLDVASFHASDAEGAPPAPIDIFLGNGDGTFAIGTSVALPGGAFPASLTASDFNGDGKTDLAVLSRNKVYIYPGHGDGTFSTPITVTTTFSAGGSEAPSPPFKLRVGDFDGDGKPDLLLSDPNHAAVLFNNGSYSFQQKDVTGESAFVVDFVAADVNQDGFTDFLVSLQGDCPPSTSPCQGGYAVYLSQGSARIFKVSFRQAPTFNQFPPINPTVADLDGDGINDFIFFTGSFHPALHIAKGNANGSYGRPRNIILSDINGATGLVAVDLNRDGRPDLVSTNWISGELYTSLNAFLRSTCTATAASPSVTVCQPSDNTYSKSPLHVVAKAIDTAHSVTSIQIYVDGQLKSTTSASSVDTSLSLSSGPHVLSVKAWDSSNKNFRSIRTVNIYSGTTGQVCSAGLDSLHICVPAAGASVVSPVRVFAANNSDLENTSIQVYVDHQLTFSDHTANFVDHSFTLSPGTHGLTVKGWDASGRQLSQSETVQVTN